MTWRPTPTADPHAIAHGYNLADIDHLARIALSRCWARSGDYLDRYQAAWSAIALELCAPTPPEPIDLITAATHAISRYVQTEMRHHGAHDGTTRGRYEAYWTPGACEPIPDRIVDALALWEILPLLTEGQRQAINALAATADIARAAELLGVTERAIFSRLAAARKIFFRWWHEGETPSRVWRVSKRSPRDGMWRGRARLTEAEVARIRDRWEGGETQAMIAVDYGVTQRTVSGYLTGKIRAAT